MRLKESEMTVNLQLRPHNPKAVGSNPTPATSRLERAGEDRKVHPALSVWAGRFGGEEMREKLTTPQVTF